MKQVTRIGANAKRGKQQGENIAVKKSPAVPILSMLLFSFIYFFSIGGKVEICAVV